MRITEVNLTKKQRLELEYTLHFDPRCFMQTRSQIVLYKADGLSSKTIAEKLSCSEHKVNRWVKRYISEGIEGLRNKPGQGCKPIMDSSDTQAVIDAIEKDRLSVMKAKERWEQAKGKEACRDTFSGLFYQPWRKFARQEKGSHWPQPTDIHREKRQISSSN